MDDLVMDRVQRDDAETLFGAIDRRDPAADGSFVYSVRTTGVYCRPSCPSRPARRENVAFHATCADAERAGFRPCQRCRPSEPSQAERDAAAVARACRAIDAAETPPALDALAATAGLSTYHFHRVFKRVTGVTPRAYASQRRAARVAIGLRTAETITHAIYDGGYNASSRFYEATRLGMTPSAYRAGGAGQTLRFAIGDSSLGAVLVAATATGVCAIMIGDEPEALARDLRVRFPKAEISGGDADFAATVAAVVSLVEQPGRRCDLPLDIAGTAFQQRVWAALRDIPAGTTTTYAAIAGTIGAPGAVRAVATACGANKLAVAIPCHRVVRTDGALAGYRWGVARKRALLDREAEPRRSEV